MPSNNPEYAKTYIRKHYQENKQYYLDKSKQSKQRYQDWIDSLKNSPCLDCDVSYPPCVMDFDHTDPNAKSFNIGLARRNGMAKSKVLAEIAKCELVCANCHRLRTFT